MKEEAQAHYFRTILANPIPVRNIQNTDSLKEYVFFIILSKPKRLTAFRSFCYRGPLLSERTHHLQTEKTVMVCCLLFRIRPPKRVLSIDIVNRWYVE